MKVVVGHKNLSLEELFEASQMKGNIALAEVEVDSAIYSELSKAPPKDKVLTSFSTMHKFAQNFSSSEIRAILVAKLVQLLKLKANCQAQVVDSILDMLNSKVEYKADFFEFLYEGLAKRGSIPSEKERFILNSVPLLHIVP